MAHLKNFADCPHPMGNEENHRARAYLESQLQALGVEVRVEPGIGQSSRGRTGRVENIVGTFRGTGAKPAIMLVAHYDSVPGSPGAADDGAGVITILETVRALNAGPSRAHDLIVLLTDGEEAGLLGASAFVAAHPHLAQDVGVAMNLEARGSSGPALMFETSERNGRLIREFARAAPYPVASSLMAFAYKLLPNDTDMTVFKRAGLNCLNFAFIETLQDYHTPRDCMETLDPRSVQHLGSNVLALVRQFDKSSLDEGREPDLIYFNWLGSRIMVYPQWFAHLLNLLVFVLLAVATLKGRAEKLFTLRGVVLGSSCFLALWITVSGAMVGTWNLLRFATGSRLLIGDTFGNQLLLLGFVLLGLAVGGLVLRICSRSIGRFEVAVGQLLAVAILSALATYFSPGVSYIFVWVCLAGLCSLVISLCGERREFRPLLSFCAVVPAVLLFAPLISSLFIALQINPVSLLAIATLLSIGLGCTSPLVHFLFEPVRRTVPLLLFASLLFLIGGKLLSPPTAGILPGRLVPHEERPAPRPRSEANL